MMAEIYNSTYFIDLPFSTWIHISIPTKMLFICFPYDTTDINQIPFLFGFKIEAFSNKKKVSFAINFPHKLFKAVKVKYATTIQVLW